MDDLTQKITSILNDPSSLQTIKSIAESLTGGESQSGEKQPESLDFTQAFNSMSADQIGSIMQIMGALNSKSGDDRTALLLALKPHLSSQRRDRVDKAVKLLKLASVIPFVTESGIFNL